jgi:hypothetical protein
MAGNTRGSGSCKMADVGNVVMHFSQHAPRTLVI